MLIMSWIGIIFCALCLVAVAYGACCYIYEMSQKTSWQRQIETLTKENKILRGEVAGFRNQLDRQITVWGRLTGTSRWDNLVTFRYKSFEDTLYLSVQSPLIELKLFKDDQCL